MAIDKDSYLNTNGGKTALAFANSSGIGLGAQMMHCFRGQSGGNRFSVDQSFHFLSSTRCPVRSDTLHTLDDLLKRRSYVEICLG